MSNESINPGNAFNNIVSSLIDFSYQGMANQTELSEVNKLQNENLNDLTAAMTSCPESNPSDPGYGAWYFLMKAEGNTAALKGKPFPQQNQLPDKSGLSKKTQMTMNTWISTFIDATNSGGDTGWLETRASQSFITTVIGAYLKNAPSKSSHSKLPVITQLGNLIAADAKRFEQPSQNNVSLLNNTMQHMQTSQGPITQDESTILDGYNNFASSLSQITA